MAKNKGKTTTKTTKMIPTETKPKPTRRGSPSQYSVKVQPFLEDIARYVRCGVTEGQLCAYYGVGTTQWAAYKKDNPELSEIVYNAKKEHKSELINRSHQVAVGYDYEEIVTVEFYVIKDGVKTITGGKTTTYKKHAKADTGMLQFLLINRYHDEFARDPQILELRKKALEMQKQQEDTSDWEGV